MLNNREYYTARAEAARGLAGRAASAAIANIHFNLATGYEAKARDGDHAAIQAGNSLQAA